MKKTLKVFCFLLVTSISTFAQLGPQPSKTKWKYIENASAKVIFAANNEAEASRIATIADYINKNAKQTVGDKSKKVDILLNTNNAIGNGYVALGPYRSEFYATGYQNFNFLGTLNWLDALALHEYRHTLQFNNSKRGFTKFMSILMGEFGWSVASNFSIPDWFFEGDAVLSESVLTGLGRGRTPNFFEQQRALLLNNKNYSYATARNGSYKKLLPNHYPLGYSMVNYGRNHFGADVWAKVLADAGAYKKIIYPFSRALKSHTGLSTKGLYKATYKEMKENWQAELKTTKLTASVALTDANKRNVTNYFFPNILNDGSIACLKNSFRSNTVICRIKNGKEQKVTTVGSATESYLSVNNDKLAWTEIRKDPRRDAVVYSVIMGYDLKTNKKNQITNKSKLFSPMFSSDGKRLIAVKADENIDNNLVIVDSKSGEIIETIPNAKNDFLSYPKWNKDESAIIYLTKRNSKITITKYDLASKTTTDLMPWTSHPIGSIAIGKESVSFVGSFNGINNIYSVSFSGDGKIYQQSSVKIDATDPTLSADGKLLFISELTPNGRQLTKLVIGERKLISITEPDQMARYNLNVQDYEVNALNNLPDRTYQVKNYSGLIKGAKLHSWQITPIGKNQEVSIMIDNILNDFSAKIVGYRNGNENTFSAGGKIVYAKYLLPITLSANTGQRSNPLYLADGETIGSRVFNQRDFSAGLSLPLSWVKGYYTTGLRLSSEITNISTDSYKIEEVAENTKLNFNTLKTGLSFIHVRDKALQNVNNKWSQKVDINYEKALKNVSAERFTGSIGLSFPGFAKNHVLELAVNGKKENSANQYLFNDVFVHARGYQPAPSDAEVVSSINYGLPLFNIDKGILGIIYFKRVTANLFYDVAQIEYRNKNSQQKSIGTELIIDTKILNALPIKVGLRNSVLLDKDLQNKDAKSAFNLFFATGF